MLSLNDNFRAKILRALVGRKQGGETMTTVELLDELRRENSGAFRQLFCDIFGAEPWVAIKFKGSDWFFISVEDLEEKGKTYVTDVEMAQRKGLLFEELVNWK